MTFPDALRFAKWTQVLQKLLPSALSLPPRASHQKETGLLLLYFAFIELILFLERILHNLRTKVLHIPLSYSRNSTCYHDFFNHAQCSLSHSPSLPPALHPPLLSFFPPPPSFPSPFILFLPSFVTFAPPLLLPLAFPFYLILPCSFLYSFTIERRGISLFHAKKSVSGLST